MTSCALVTEVRTCALPIYPAMMRGRHLVEQVPTFLGESHNRRSAVVGIDGRHDKFLSLKLTDDRGDIALRDKQRSRQIPHRLPVGITIERGHHVEARSEEHTSELQSLMRISYAVFCLKKQTRHKKN